MHDVLWHDVLWYTVQLYELYVSYHPPTHESVHSLVSRLKTWSIVSLHPHSPTCSRAVWYAATRDASVSAAPHTGRQRAGGNYKAEVVSYLKGLR